MCKYNFLMWEWMEVKFYVMEAFAMLYKNTYFVLLMLANFKIAFSKNKLLLLFGKVLKPD